MTKTTTRCSDRSELSYEARGQLIPRLIVQHGVTKAVVHIAGNTVEVGVNSYGGVFTKILHGAGVSNADV